MTLNVAHTLTNFLFKSSSPLFSAPHLINYSVFSPSILFSSLTSPLAHSTLYVFTPFLSDFLFYGCFSCLSGSFPFSSLSFLLSMISLPFLSWHLLPICQSTDSFFSLVPHLHGGLPPCFSLYSPSPSQSSIRKASPFSPHSSFHQQFSLEAKHFMYCSMMQSMQWAYFP